MIESNILSKIDLGDSIQKLNIYNNNKLLKLFKIFENLILLKKLNKMMFIVYNIIYFIQFNCLSLINIKEEDYKNDDAIKLHNSIKKYLVITYLINNKNDYILYGIMVLIFAFIILIFVLFILIFLKLDKNKPSHIFSLHVLNFINDFLIHYGLCQILNINLLSLYCKNGDHKYLEVKCFKNFTHLIVFIVSLILFLFFFIYSLILSIYYYEIGSIPLKVMRIRTNSNNEIYNNILSIIFYVFAFIIKYYCTEENYLSIYQIFICLFSIFKFIYIYKYVFYYDNIYNYLINFGWAYIFWFNFSLLMKRLLKIENSIFLVLGGIIIIYIIIVIFEQKRITNCLYNKNIIFAKNIKQIETFTHYLINYCLKNSNYSKLVVQGILKCFETNNVLTVDMLEDQNKFNNNIYLNQFFKENKDNFHVFGLITTIYEYFLYKTNLKNDILFIYSYYLVNHLKNPTYAFYLCNKIKTQGHKNIYLKYILLEQIKKFQIKNLTNNKNEDNIKNMEISSVILFQKYIETLKLNIYEATNSQIEYLDIIKNTNVTNKTSKKFIKFGNNIISNKKKIIKLWEKINNLNPYNEEIENDYFLYLENIIQDNLLAQKERKKLLYLKTVNLKNLNKLYYQLFNKEKNSIILVDSYLNNGKIIYTTNNFQYLFHFTSKECYNMTIYDLLPTNIASFHKELEEYSIKYSNISFIYSSYKYSILKAKNNAIYNIKMYIKSIPNLSYGLIYIVLIEKINDGNFIIILDENFRITGFSNGLTLGKNENFIYNNLNVYGLSQDIIGIHIAVIIPEILFNILFKNGQYIIKNENIEIKSLLYPINNNYIEFDKKIEGILNNIKEFGKLDEKFNNNEPMSNNFSKKKLALRKLTRKNYNISLKSEVQLYKEFFNEIKDSSEKQKYNIFYKIIKRTFINNKYTYYKIFVTNDLIQSKYNDIVKEKNNLTINIAQNNLNDNSELKIKKKNKIKGIKINIKNTNPKETTTSEDSKNNEEFKIIQTNLNNDNDFEEYNLKNIKKYIFYKKKPKIIFSIQLCLILYSAITIILINFDNYDTKNIFNNFEKFLSENYIFNRTKISAACIYSETILLKNIKYKLFEKCNIIDCKQTFGNFLQLCLNHLTLFIDSIIYYNPIYLEKLNKEHILDIYSLSTNLTIPIKITNLNILHFFVSNMLLVDKNILDYFDNANSTYEANLENLINISYLYALDEENVGFTNNEIKKYSKKSTFSKKNTFFIINIIIFVFTILLIVYFIYIFHNYEMYFLKKLIKFSNQDFDNYFNFLKDLKKKLMNTNLINEDSNGLNEEEENNKNNNMTSVIEEEINSKKILNITNKENEIEKLKDKKNKSVKYKQKKTYINFIINQRNEKYKTMSSFFLFDNLLFFIKLLISLIFPISYYFFLLIVYNDKRKDFINFDELLNNLDGIYKDISLILVKIKKQYINHINFSIKKQSIIESLKLSNNENYTIEFYGENYSLSNIDELNDLYYTVSVDELSTSPKIGNILTDLLKKSSSDDDSLYGKLFNLYNGDACSLLYENSLEELEYCNSFNEGIIMQGFEQAFIQLNIILTNFISKVNARNNGEEISINDIWDSIENYLVFTDKIYTDGYILSSNLFSHIRNNKKRIIKRMFSIFFYSYLITYSIFFIIILYFVRIIKNTLVSFFNFICIIPSHYLIKDEELYYDIIKLEKKF